MDPRGFGRICGQAHALFWVPFAEYKYGTDIFDDLRIVVVR
jgi:hypothetical protein